MTEEFIEPCQAIIIQTGTAVLVAGSPADQVPQPIVKGTVALTGVLRTRMLIVHSSSLRLPLTYFLFSVW